MEENKELLEYNCTHCGTRVSREDTRCSACGAELEGFIDENSDTSTFTFEDETQIEQTKVQEYFCPDCGTKLNREDSRCPKCGAQIEGFENDDNDLTVELKKYTNEVVAEMAKSLLEAEGIECFLKGGNSLGTVFSPFPIRLVVLKRDMKRALEILES
jgi:hypothetical protein